VKVAGAREHSVIMLIIVFVLCAIFTVRLVLYLCWLFVSKALTSPEFELGALVVTVLALLLYIGLFLASNLTNRNDVVLIKTSEIPERYLNY
jgi:Sec-independent protein secretion pathway component TatC